MILSSSGAGYLCWPCQLRGEIAEHQLGRRIGRGHVALLSAALLLGTWLAVTVIEVLAYLAHPC